MVESPRMNVGSPVSVAPMMDWTDRHCRYFLRLLSPGALLYTEMITAAAIVHGDRDSLLRFDSAEHPVAVQLGGSNVDWMTEAARASAAAGYDEININVGCPSDRVQSGQFGACLMATPGTVAACFRAMQAVVDVPVSIKMRIGIDDQDSYAFLREFVDTLAGAGCRKFVIHARIAILEGLSPRQNREVPPLRYDRVFRIKEDYPDLEIVLNGGVQEIAQVDEVLEHVDGVMIGRRVYQDPYFLAQLEAHMNPGWTPPSRHGVARQMLPYIEAQLAEGEKLGRITRHMLGLYAGQPRARGWRRYLSEHAFRDGAGTEVLTAALDSMREAA